VTMPRCISSILTSATVHAVQVCTYGGMPRLSTNTILSVRSSRSSSAHQTTSDLEALFASCTLSVDLQNMANTADTSAALWPLR
jgi:hypothetical protein